MELHIKDISLLNELQRFFNNVGIVTIKKTRPHAVFTVTKLEDITNVIIPHFSQYHLLTKKVIDFNLFKSAVKIMNHKGHLEKEGLNQIVSIKYSMNRGLLSDKLKESFPNVEPFIGDRMLFSYSSSYVDKWFCNR